MYQRMHGNYIHCSFYRCFCRSIVLYKYCLSPIDLLLKDKIKDFSNLRIFVQIMKYKIPMTETVAVLAMASLGNETENEKIVFLLHSPRKVEQALLVSQVFFSTTISHCDYCPSPQIHELNKNN